MKRKAKTLVKFGVTLLMMTAASAIFWNHMTGRLYDCTDDCGLGFLTPGSWVHRFGGRDIVSAPMIVHGRSMGEPDTILQGWSIGKLWALWGLFATVTLGVSTFVACVPWGSRRFNTTQDANQASEVTARKLAEPQR